MGCLAWGWNTLLVLPRNSKSGPFSARGDSGSVVVDGIGRICGILTVDGLLRHLHQLHPQALGGVRYQGQYLPLAKRSRNAIPSLDPQVHSIIIRTGSHYLRAGKALFHAFKFMDQTSEGE